MSLIERLGGYGAAKLEGKEWGFDDFLLRKLLEYRRENNIFEHGDYIVWLFDYEPAHLYQVKYITENGYSYGNDWGWYGVLSNEGVGYNFRHATDEEIKAGRRL